MDILQTLRSAKALVNDRWSKTGDEVGKYCLGQALIKFCDNKTATKAAKVFAVANGIVMPTPHWSPLFHFNDTHTHEEVLAAFDKAIEHAEKSS